jgi:glutamate/tyrosine decarboxylase-like PLP-dependent enzyme
MKKRIEQRSHLLQVISHVNLEDLRQVIHGYMTSAQTCPGDFVLKVWATLKAYGTRRLGRTIEQSCQLARELGERILAEPELELLAPVNLNIVCFRYRGKSDEVDDLNREIVADVQESGLAVPSTTILGGKLAIRAALINHRTRAEDVTRLVEAVLRFGRQRTKRPRG